MTKTQQMIAEEFDALKSLVLRKNQSYGDSALAPIRILSKASPQEQILVRMDDKLSRLSSGTAFSDETLVDTMRDLAGYAVLYLVSERIKEELSR